MRSRYAPPDQVAHQHREPAPVKSKPVKATVPRTPASIVAAQRAERLRPPPGNALLSKEAAAQKRAEAGKGPKLSRATFGGLTHGWNLGEILNPPHRTVVIGGKREPVGGGSVLTGPTLVADTLRQAPQVVKHALDVGRQVGEASKGKGKLPSDLDILLSGAVGIPRGGVRRGEPPKQHPLLSGKPTLPEAKPPAPVPEAAAVPKASTLTPQQQLREGMKGARSQYGKEKTARLSEAAVREKAAAEALRTIRDPHEALAASGAALRGKYAQIDYKGLKELNPQTVRQLMTDAQNHPALGFHQKRTVMKALDAAVKDGRVPRPHEQRLIEMVFGKKTAAALAQQVSQGAGDKIINAINIPRSLQSTLDVSGLMRQNLVAGASHPIIWGRNVPKAFKALKSQAAHDAYEQGIRDRTLYPMALKAGIQFTGIGEHTPLAAHEEGFASDYATKIPVLGHAIKGSARAYVTTGNAMKMDLFEHRIRLAMAAGQNYENDKALRQIGQVINAATGRGTLPGRAEHLLPAMNTFMYSPRLMLSRLHYLDPTWYFRLKGPARREALRGLFATAGAVSSALYLFSRIPGVTVGSLDPRSSEFGKLKVGNIHVDIAGGFQQYVRLAAELATNTQVSSSGKKTKLGSGFGVPTRFDVLTNFGVNKLAPAPGLDVAGLRGHDPVGNELTWQSVAQNYLTPFTFQDAKDVYNEKHGGVDGITWAIGAYGLAALGVGVQTYKPRQSKSKNRGTGSIYAPASGGSRSIYAPSP